MFLLLLLSAINKSLSSIDDHIYIFNYLSYHISKKRFQNKECNNGSGMKKKNNN